jgi:hypothetical protein
MAMDLTCTRMFSRIEEGKQPLRLLFRSISLPCLETRISNTEIILLQESCLRLPCFGGQNEMVGNNWIFVEDNEVRRIGFGNFSNCLPQLAKNTYLQFWEDYMDELRLRP